MRNFLCFYVNHLLLNWRLYRQTKQDEKKTKELMDRLDENLAELDKVEKSVDALFGKDKK